MRERKEIEKMLNYLKENIHNPRIRFRLIEKPKHPQCGSGFKFQGYMDTKTIIKTLEWILKKRKRTWTQIL